MMMRSILCRVLENKSHSMIFLSIYLLSGIGAVAASDNTTFSNCPSDWFGDGTFCFYISDYLTSWDVARDYCRYMEADLVAIGDAQMQQQIAAYIPQPNRFLKGFWIGLSDLRSPGVFEWVDSESQTTYTDWLDDISSWNSENATGNCVTIDLKTRKWKTENCTSQQGFICGRKGLMDQAEENKKNSPCDEGMKKFKESCYWTVPDTNNWQAAEKWCESEGGHLTTISSSLENIFVHELVRPKGSIYLKTKPSWIGLHIVDGGFFWVAAKDFVFSNWDGEPSLLDGLCAVIERNGKWIMQPCNSNQISNAVCEKTIENDMITSVSPRSLGTCPYPWIGFENECFMVVKDPMTWEGARNQCLSLGGDLVFLKSQDDEIRVLDLVTEGGNKSSVSLDYWMGLRLINVSEDKDLKWNDGSSVAYTNWNVPLVDRNVSTEDEFCVLFEVVSGQWNTVPCSLKAMFVCEKQDSSQIKILKCEDISSCLSTIISPTTEPSLSTTISEATVPVATKQADPCPQNWVQFDYKCYLIKGEYDNEKINWTEASRFCRNLGEEYDLVSIHSQMEYTFLLNEIENRSLIRIWIGLNDKAVEGTFVWTDGSPFDFEDWGWQDRMNVTNNFNRRFSMTTLSRMTADCVKIDASPHAVVGKWTTTDCAVPLGYICQKKLTTSYVPTTLPIIGPVTTPSTSPPLPTTTKEIVTEPTTTTSTTEQTTTTTILPFTTSIILEELTKKLYDDEVEDYDTFTTELPNYIQQQTNLKDITTPEFIINTEAENDSVIDISESPEITNNEVSQADTGKLVTNDCKCGSTKSKMTSGTIAGITLSCILAVVLIITLSFYIHQRRRFATNYGTGKLSFDNALYNPHGDHIQLDTNVPSIQNSH